MATLESPLHPDRLVAFLDAVYAHLHDESPGGAPDDMRRLINEAVEANLPDTELTVPAGYDPTEPPANETAIAAHAYERHQWAFALTGATAKARTALSQIGVSDGETRGLDGAVQPDRVGDLVAEVTDRMAREAAGEPTA